MQQRANKFIHETLRDSAYSIGGGDKAQEVIHELLFAQFEQWWVKLKEPAGISESGPHDTISSIASLGATQSDIEAMPWHAWIPWALPDGRGSHELHVAFALMRLSDTGEHIYQVSDQVTSAFYESDVNIDSEALRFPHDSFIVYWGAGGPRFTLNQTGDPEWLAPLVWTFCDYTQVNDSVVIVRLMDGWIDQDGDPANSQLQAFSYRTGEKLQTARGTGFPRRDDRAVSAFEADDAVYASYHMLFNFLLYLRLMAEDRLVIEPPDFSQRLANIRNPKKRRRLEKQMSRRRYTYIGRHYTPLRGSDGKGSSAAPEGARVRGHWRYQWIGKRTDNYGNHQKGEWRRLTWVRPHVRGDVDAAESGLVRVVI